MAGGNPFMPPGSSLPPGMPGANPAGPVPGGPLAGSLAKGGFGAGPDPNAPAAGPAMTPGQGPGRGVPPGGQPSIEQVGRMAQARYTEGMKTQKIFDHLRTELDQLLDMGDMIRPEDVLEAAGRLVGHGIGAAQIAQLMSDMPAMGGEGLASWIRMHDMTVTQAEQALIQENDLRQHQLGMIGMRMLTEHHVQDRINMHMQNAQQMMAAQMGQPNMGGQPPKGGDMGPGGGSMPGGGMNDLGGGDQNG